MKDTPDRSNRLIELVNAVRPLLRRPTVNRIALILVGAGSPLVAGGILEVLLDAAAQKWLGIGLNFPPAAPWVGAGLIAVGVALALWAHQREQRQFDESEWPSFTAARPAIARAVQKSLKEDQQTTLHVIGAGMMQSWDGLEHTFLYSWPQNTRVTLCISMADTNAPAIQPLKERWRARQEAYKKGLAALRARRPNRKLAVRHSYYADLPPMMGVLINRQKLFLERFELRGDETAVELTAIYNSSGDRLCILHERGKDDGTAVIAEFLDAHRKGIPQPEENVDQGMHGEAPTAKCETSIAGI